MFARLAAALGLVLGVAAAAVAFIDTGGTPPAVAQATLARVVGEGDPSPLGGSPFRNLSFLQLGDDGSVAFSGCVDACDRAGIFLKQPAEATSQALVVTGELAPSLSALVGFECNRYFPFSRNDAGSIGFGALLDGCNSGRAGAYTRTNLGVSTLAESGDVIDGKTISVFSGPELANNGGTAFSAYFDSHSTSGVVVGNNIILEPNTNLWAEAKLVGIPTLVGMNDSSELLHVSAVEELGATSNCMIISSPSAIFHTRVACVGDVLFGLALDGQIKVMDFNNSGHLVFGSSDQAVYYWSGSSVKVAQAGEDAPGGGKYQQFLGYPHLNDLDQLTYTAQVEFDDGRVAHTVFLYANGASTPLYVAGTDTDPASGRCVFDIDLNDAAQVLVGVNDCGGGATSYFIGAIPAVDPTPTPTSTVTPSPPRQVVIFVQGYASCLTAGREYGSSCGTDSVEDEVFRALKEELRAVGFEEADFLEFSYSGGHVDELSGRWIPDDYACTEPSSRTYEAPAFELRSMVMAYRARHPNVEIALVGHSFGGLVALEATRYVLAGVDTSGITTVVTVDSPLNGVPANWFSNARDNVLAFLDTWLNRFPCQRPFLDSPATDSVKALYGASGNSAALRPNRELKREAIDAGIAIWNAGNTSDCIWVPSSCNPYENLEREVARWRGDYAGTQFIGNARNIRVRIVPACQPARRRCTFGDAAATHSALLTSSRSVAPTVRRQIAACIIGPQVGDPNVC